MWFVYIIIDKKDNRYIGYTEDIDNRFKEHKQKIVFSTKNFIEPKLYYYEAYSTKKFAIRRERNLKKFGSAYTGLIKRIGLNK